MAGVPFIVEAHRMGKIDTVRLAAVSSATLGVAAAKLADACAPFGSAPFGPWADARERAKAITTAGTVLLPEGCLHVVETTRGRLMCEIGFRALGLPELADDKWPWSTEQIVAAFNRTFGCGIVIVID